MIRIIESNYITSAVNPKGYPETAWKDFAFVGRSNVGKSSMINALTNRKLLAKIANKPGKTRLINFFEIKFKRSNKTISDAQERVEMVEESTPGFFCLVDLPGYGFARVSKTEREQWQKMIHTFFHSRTQLCGIVLLVDIRHEPDPKDEIMINMLKELNIDFMVAGTKCDKIPKNTIPSQIKKLKEVFCIDASQLCAFSSVKKIGQDKILGWIESKIFITETNNRVILH